MNRLKELRTQQGLSQQRVADYCNVSKSYISRLENPEDKREIPSSMIPPLQRLLDLPNPAALFREATNE